MPPSSSPAPPPWRRELRALLAIAWPLVVNNLFTMGMQVADTVMAGRLGPRDLAAVAIGGAVWTPLLLLGLGTLSVVSAGVARLAGAGGEAGIRALVQHGLVVGVGLGLALMLLLRGCDPLLALIGLEAPVAVLTRGYLAAMAWGAVGIFLYQVLRFASEGLGSTRPIMLVGVLGFAVNIAGNWILMYGHFGLPALGAVGCGWASAVTMWVMALAMAGWIGAGRRYGAIRLYARPEPLRGALIADLLRVGLPAGVTIFLEAGLFATVALLMGWMGTATVAAHQIAINYAALMFMVPLGVAFATTVRVGNAAGRGDRAAVRRAGHTGMALGAGFMCLSAAVMLGAGEHIVALYSADPAVAAVARGLLLVAAAFQIFDGAQVCANGALRGLRDTRVPMLITLVAYWGTGFPIAWLLGIHLALGPQAIWLGLVAGLAAAAVLLWLRFDALAPGRARAGRAGAGGTHGRRP